MVVLYENRTKTHTLQHHVRRVHYSDRPFRLSELNLVLTKLRFVEIADDLNASFLEMRLSEKNYFLHHDPEALDGILSNDRDRRNIRSAACATISSRPSARAICSSCNPTSRNMPHVIREGGSGGKCGRGAHQGRGRKLKEFSDSITHLERKRVNDIIVNSQRILIFSFWAILFIALFLGHFISQKIVSSLRAIEKQAKSISEGNFNRIEGFRTRDELGSVITAINSMSEELASREEQILQSKKLASMGILTAGVAHEITNPLNNISMIAQTYDELYANLSEQDRIEFMQKVDAETERIRKIVKNLLDFSKPKDANPEEGGHQQRHPEDADARPEHGGCPEHRDEGHARRGSSARLR